MSFEKEIQPLFRQFDIDAMVPFGFNLASYEDVKAHAQLIYDRLADGSMPCDEPWADEQVAKFKRWMDEGMQP